MSGLPQSYMSPLHLPFNRTCLEPYFELQTPDRGSQQPGVWLVLQGHRLVVLPAADGFVLPHDPPDDLATDRALHLGLWQGRPCRLLKLDRDAVLPAGWQAHSFVEENPQLPIELLSLAGLGRMVLHWDRGGTHCSTCGDRMTYLPGQWGKACANCKTHHFPHIHPCAIILVRRPGEVLLTRKPQWAPNRYSLVAGFTEFGESLEETAAREVFEETGVRTSNVRYVGSQCWPFPSQLMCGFVGDYAGGEIKVDRTELADARWFRVDDLPALPPRRSIARYLLDTELGLDAGD